MISTTIGDLSQSLLMRRQATTLKTEIGRLTSEMSSGRTSDVTSHLMGSFGQLADVEYRLQVQSTRQAATAEAGMFADAMQSALDVIQVRAADLGATASLAQTSPAPTTRAAAASMARGVLDTVLSALNTQVAGRSLFAGTDVSGPAIGPLETLVSEAQTALAGVTDATSFRAALDAFFDIGGGFETLIYQGNTQDPSPFQLGDGQSVQLSLRADDGAFRDVLKQALTIYLADNPSISLSSDSRNSLVQTGAEAVLTGADRIVGIQADLGFAQSRIEEASVRIASELTGLDYSRNALLSVDPYETASALTALQFQLESLYTVTARSARLNLMNFL